MNHVDRVFAAIGDITSTSNLKRRSGEQGGDHHGRNGSVTLFSDAGRVASVGCLGSLLLLRLCLSLLWARADACVVTTAVRRVRGAAAVVGVRAVDRPRWPISHAVLVAGAQ